VRLEAERPTELLNRLTGWALARSVDLGGLEVRRPSLEDIYLELTGAEEVQE
jgi:ABC-2 type transport system ATP-binding protein